MNICKHTCMCLLACQGLVVHPMQCVPECRHKAWRCGIKRSVIRCRVLHSSTKWTDLQQGQHVNCELCKSMNRFSLKCKVIFLSHSPPPDIFLSHSPQTFFLKKWLEWLLHVQMYKLTLCMHHVRCIVHHDWWCVSRGFSIDDQIWACSCWKLMGIFVAPGPCQSPHSIGMHALACSLQSLEPFPGLVSACYNWGASLKNACIRGDQNNGPF